MKIKFHFCAHKVIFLTPPKTNGRFLQHSAAAPNAEWYPKERGRGGGAVLYHDSCTTMCSSAGQEKEKACTHACGRNVLKNVCIRGIITNSVRTNRREQRLFRFENPNKKKGEGYYKKKSRSLRIDHMPRYCQIIYIYYVSLSPGGTRTSTPERRGGG
ncbi:unnamed protein product, partial [Ectocarpus sp. 8 AP-2014]